MKVGRVEKDEKVEKAETTATRGLDTAVEAMMGHHRGPGADVCFFISSSLSWYIAVSYRRRGSMTLGSLYLGLMRTEPFFRVQHHCF